MAGAQKVLGLPYTASAAVTARRFVKLTGDQTVGPITAITDLALGVVDVSVTADEATNGKGCTVEPIGVVWVEAAAAIARDALVAPSANGRAQTAVSTQFVAGRALKAAAAAGDLIPVLLFNTAVALA